MTRSRRSLVLLIPAAILFVLACWLAGRFWLAPDPQVPSFTPARPVAFPTPAPALPSEASLRRAYGRVLDETGAGVEGALVHARVDGVPHWSWSGAGGDYELTWSLAAQPDDSSQVQVSLAAFGHPPSMLGLPAAGGAHDLVLTPREPDPTTPPVAQNENLRGRLLRAPELVDRRPFAYEVVLSPSTPPEEFGTAVARRAPCAPDGSFVVPALAHGEYVVAVLPLWAEGGSWPDVLANAGARITHPSEDEPSLELASGSLHGVTRDGSGAVVEGALVLVTGAADPGRLWPPTASDSLGHFELFDLPAGGYRVAVQAGEARVLEVDVEVLIGERSEVPLPPLELRSQD